jgi:3-mercaptopyruvate sulfurtransferase SseA
MRLTEERAGLLCLFIGMLFAAFSSPIIAAKDGETFRHKGLISCSELESKIASGDTVIIDLRKIPLYNRSHIHGSLSLSYESLRGNIQGVGSLLLPSPLLAAHYSMMGIKRSDTIVFVYGDAPQDAALAAMSCERLGHKKFAILNGGFGEWKHQNKAGSAAMPNTAISEYPPQSSDDFTVDYNEVFSAIGNEDIVIIDVRPEEFYNGTKSDEARAGHIPGAISRPFTKDTESPHGFPVFRSPGELAAAYEKIIPSKDTTVIVHCRTGREASQTFFVLKHILDYENVLWYDAGWSQWAAIEQLPVE